MNRRPRIVVSAVLAFLFATQNVASAAPRGDVGGPRLGRLGATKRAFKATDKVKLDGGEEVSAQRYADEMNQLQAALVTQELHQVGNVGGVERFDQLVHPRLVVSFESILDCIDEIAPQAVLLVELDALLPGAFVSQIADVLVGHAPRA